MAVISGGARGQGAAEAHRFIEEGASAVVGDVLDDEGTALAGQLGDGCHFEHLDVTSESDWVRVIGGTVERLGRLDVLVNNAGILRFNRFVDTPLDEYLDVVMVNQVGTFLGIRAAIPPMKEAGGSIINVSSIEGLRGMKNLASYTSSKFAVRGLTKVAALELARFGIRVNSIHPGMVKTPMTDFGNMDAVEAIIPLKRPATAAEVADLVVYLASPESAYCTGAEFVIDGGVTAGSMFSAI